MLDEARFFLEEAESALREQGNEYGLFRALFVLAQVMTMQGHGAQARPNFREALRMQQQMRYVYTTADCLESFGGLEAAQGRPIQAVRLFGAAQAHREATGMHRWPHRNRWYEHDVAVARGQITAAAWDAAWAAGADLTLEEAVAEALAG